jgi:hypothetical protein
VHAVIGVWAMEGNDTGQAERELNDVIVPGVRKNPGFVAGYWSRESNSNTNHTFIVFETEDQAHAFANAVRQNQPRQQELGVQRNQLTVVEVVAEAQR